MSSTLAALFLLVTYVFADDINQIATDYYHAAQDFSIDGYDIGVQQNFIRLSSGKFLILDTINLTAGLLNAINTLTANGTLIDSVLGTHPFHTIFFPAFYKQFPNALYYGTPRHLRNIKSVKWAGSLWDCQNRMLWPDVLMRIPRGSEFVNPQPESSNHFSGIHVFHTPTGILHVDDTINIILDVLSFHPSIFNVGLYHVEPAVAAYKGFFQDLLSDWNVTSLCVAHRSSPMCRPNSYSAMVKLLDFGEAIFLGLEIEFTAFPNATQGAAFQVMEAHENTALCMKAGGQS